jgi:hypothetical protein
MIQLTYTNTYIYEETKALQFLFDYTFVQRTNGHM